MRGFVFDTQLTKVRGGALRTKSAVNTIKLIFFWDFFLGNIGKRGFLCRKMSKMSKKKKQKRLQFRSNGKPFFQKKKKKKENKRSG